MSILVDKLFKEVGNWKQLDGQWYIAKDMRNWSFNNVIDAVRVFTGKSRAYHFKEDEIKSIEKGRINHGKENTHCRAV
jgi:hypothetical protein